MSQYTFCCHGRLIMTIALIVTGTGIANSYGGKTHSEALFFAFQAILKAIQLYGRLIVSGKLPEDWETGSPSS